MFPRAFPVFISRCTPLVGAPPLSTLPQRHSWITRIFFLHPNWTAGNSSIRSFEISVPLGIQFIQSRPYRPNSPLQQVDAIWTLHSCRHHPAFHVSMVEPSCFCSKEFGRHPYHSQLPKTEQGHRDPPECDSPVNEVLDTPGGSTVFSVFDLFSGLLSSWVLFVPTVDPMNDFVCSKASRTSLPISRLSECILMTQ